MSERYSHRNGETEPPTEKGWYWIDSEMGDGTYFGAPDIYCVHMAMDGRLEAESYDNADSCTLVTEIQARWWGPIPKPPLGDKR